MIFIFQTCVVVFLFIDGEIIFINHFFLNILIHVNQNVLNIENTNKRRFQNVFYVNELF